MPLWNVRPHNVLLAAAIRAGEVSKIELASRSEDGNVREIRYRIWRVTVETEPLGLQAVELMHELRTKAGDRGERMLSALRRCFAPDEWEALERIVDYLPKDGPREQTLEEVLRSVTRLQ